MAKTNIKLPGVFVLIGVLLFIMHMMIIKDDVQAVVKDPNKENKPGEILKLVFDVNRYIR